MKSTQIYLKNIEWMVIQLALLMWTKLINMHVHYKTSVKIEPAKKYQFRQHFETVFPVFKSEIDWT